MNRKHGMYGTPTWNSWSAMMKRCYQKGNASYKRYGAKGITVEKRWHEFQNFLFDMGERPEGKELDRINNFIGYKAENCRWVTRSENCRNRSSNRIITYGGISQPLVWWASYAGISVAALHRRLKIGWQFRRAITEPLDMRFQK